MDGGSPRIWAQGITRSFGTRRALDGVDLAVRSGEIHALLGPNGAGKTTLIRVLCGLVEPQQGTVVAPGGIGLVPSGDRSFYLRISALENLIFFARLHGLRLRHAKSCARELLEEVGLAEVADRPVGRCSHGMQKRLSVARALLADPEVLLVDEATHDLDPEGAVRIRALVHDRAAQGTAVLWTTQRLDEVRHFAESITVMARGSVAFRGSPAELAALAPADRYVIQIRGVDPARPPAPAAVRLAVGPSATVAGTSDDGAHFLLCPRAQGDLGVALARLVGAGLQVVACRQAQSEMEEAFLALTSFDSTSEAAA